MDEWTFGQLQNKATAQAALTNHWNTWITEADFTAIAAAGCVSFVCAELERTMNLLSVA